MRKIRYYSTCKYKEGVAIVEYRDPYPFLQETGRKTLMSRAQLRELESIKTTPACEQIVLRLAFHAYRLHA